MRFNIVVDGVHQTAEGTRLQLISNVDKTSAVVVSTLMEAWELIRAGLIADGTVNDVRRNAYNWLVALAYAANELEDTLWSSDWS
jgi:D-serine ammonia-lyase